MALIKRNDELDRFELHIEGKLIGHTIEGEIQEQIKGAKTLAMMAQEKGHRITYGEGVKLDG